MAGEMLNFEGTLANYNKGFEELTAKIEIPATIMQIAHQMLGINAERCTARLRGDQATYEKKDAEFNAYLRATEEFKKELV